LELYIRRAGGKEVEKGKGEVGLTAWRRHSWASNSTGCSGLVKKIHKWRSFIIQPHCQVSYQSI